MKKKDLSFRSCGLLCLLIASAPLILLFTSCEAPRDNPFDPKSPLYEAPSAPDAVSDLALDSLSGVFATISWTAPHRASEYRLYHGDGNWDGSDLDLGILYKGDLPGVRPPGTQQAAYIALLPGAERVWALFSDSEAGLTSEPSNLITITAPGRDRQALITAEAKSIRLSNWGAPFDWIGLVIEATVSDSDGVDSVRAYQGQTLLCVLSPRNGGMEWSCETPYYDLPNSSVEALIGRPLTIRCLDLAGYAVDSEPFFLRRVIDETPFVEFPELDTLVVNTPKLTWQWYEVNFDFTFSLQIVHISETYIPTLVFSDSLIHPDTTSYSILEPLPSTSRYLLWTISVIDEFGDEARSSEARFRVEAND